MEAHTIGRRLVDQASDHDPRGFRKDKVYKVAITVTFQQLK